MHWIAVRIAPEPQPAARGQAEAALADAMTALAWWALRFTPLVAELEQALVLEVSASERLFGGRAALLQSLQDSRPAGLALQYAQGASARLALARLCSGQPEAAADTLPLQALAAARPHLATLQRLGCNTWGQLRALPRAGVARRFGADLLDALDQAYGLRPETFAWLRLPEVFDLPLELVAAVETASALLFGAQRLLAQLQVWLRARQLGVLGLELSWTLDARRSNAQHQDAHHQGDGQGRLPLRTAQPTQDMVHLQRLLGEQLAQVTLPAPVLYIRLRSLQTQAMAGESHSLLPQDQRKGDSLHQMLERLGARLGAQRVCWVRLQAAHLPEQMQAWLPWSAAPQSQRPEAVFCAHAAMLPTWLLAQPQLLQQRHAQPQYQGPLTLLAGPQRVEAGWLEGEPVLRDYFVARSARGGLLWIFRERRAGQAQRANRPGLRWFLHGWFA